MAPNSKITMTPQPPKFESRVVDFPANNSSSMVFGNSNDR